MTDSANNEARLKHLTNVDLEDFTHGLTFDSAKVSEETKKAFEYVPDRDINLESREEFNSSSDLHHSEEAAEQVPDNKEEKKLAGIIVSALLGGEHASLDNFDEQSKIEDFGEKIEEVPIGSEIVLAIRSMISESKENESLESLKATGQALKAFEEVDRNQLLASSSSQLVINPAAVKASGLGLLAAAYTSDSDESSSKEPLQSNVLDASKVNEPRTRHRGGEVIEIDTESISSESDSNVEYINSSRKILQLRDILIEDDDEEEVCAKSKGSVRVKGELLLEDLPPIQDLLITVPEKECAHFGNVHSIVGQLVLVESIPGTPPINLDTVLFLEKGFKPLGEVFDVVGQVSSPLYCVRFNSSTHIKEKGIEIGQMVYIAPNSEHTNFVVLPELMKLRGSDASWEHDLEPTERHIEFSDDEQESLAKRVNSRIKDRLNMESEAPKKRKPEDFSTNCNESQDHQPYQRGTYQRNANPGPDPWFQEFNNVGIGNVGSFRQVTIPSYRAFDNTPHQHQNIHEQLQYYQHYQPNHENPHSASFMYNNSRNICRSSYNQQDANPYTNSPTYFPSDEMQQPIFQISTPLPPPPPPPPQ